MQQIDYDALRDATKALRFLANPKLLPILCRLGEEEVSAGELARFVGMTPSALSQHLARMKALGVVTARREHRIIHYRLADEKMRRIIDLLQELYCPQMRRAG